MSDKLTFSLIELVEETSELERYIRANESTFNNLEDNFSICADGNFYEINIKKDSDSVFFMFDYGNPMPKDDHLTNISTGEKSPNSRNEDEVELTSQLFAFYDFEKQIFYISNIQKMKFFQEIVSTQLGKKIILKKYYKTKEEFISTLKTVTEISFTDVSNIFNDKTQRNALVDLTGIEAPETFTIKATYPKGIQLLHFLEKITKGNNYKSSSLMIKGCDETDFDFVYNADNFVQKINIHVTRSENGKFVGENVISELKKILKK